MYCKSYCWMAGSQYRHNVNVFIDVWTRRFFGYCSVSKLQFENVPNDIKGYWKLTEMAEGGRKQQNMTDKPFYTTIFTLHADCTTRW